MNYIWSNFQDSRTTALFLFWKLYRLITASKSETSIFIAYNNISEYNKLRFCTHRVYRRNANPLSRRIIITIQFMNPRQYSYSGKFWKFIPMHTRSRSKKRKFNSIQKRRTCPSIPEDTNSIRNQFRFNKDSRPPPPLHHFLHPDIIRNSLLNFLERFILPGPRLVRPRNRRSSDPRQNVTRRVERYIT